MDETATAALLGQVEPRKSLDAWETAKARFLDGLDDKEKLTFNEATAENIFYTASNFQREDHRESKTRTVLENIQPLVAAVEDYGKAIDAYANISPLSLAPIWGSIRVILVIASAHGRFYNRMIDTFGRIGDILPRFRDYQRIFDGEKHVRFTQALSAAYLDIISLCTKFKTLLRNQKKSSMKRIFQPLSPALNAHLEEALLTFRKHRKVVDKEAEMCHMLEEKEARDLVVGNNAAAEARERMNKQRTLLSSLSKIDNEQKHRRMQRVRHKGTGSWLKSSKEFQRWLSCPTSAVMCCYGIPGCGKSVLTSSLIDGMLSKVIPGVIFYYCDHADKRTLDPVNIFSSLAVQILRSLGELPTGLLELLERTCRENTVPEIEDVICLLLESMKKTKSAVIVLDGLDEVDEGDRKLIFHKLRELLDPTASLVMKVFVASREDTTYLTQIPCVSSFRLRIGAKTVAGDIDSFVKHAVRDLINRRELVLGDPALEDEISNTLSKGAKGMFLSVKFQLNDLCRAETDSSIKNVLQNLPRDLGETYDRLLARINSAAQREYIKRMFVWILCARRPLNPGELGEAIAFTIEDDHFDAAKIPNDLNRLVRSCGNLILIDEDEQSVQMAHYTVEQYLLERQRPRPSPFDFTMKEASLEVGRVCVAYLSFSDFEVQLTEYTGNNTTANFSALEKVLGNQSMLPLNSKSAKAVKALKIMRGNPYSASNIRYDRQMCIPNRKAPIITKFSLLSYVSENWLYHTVDFETVDLRPRRVRRQLHLFEELVLRKKFLFDMRPWDNTPHEWQGLPHILPIGWAISNNHLPLLCTIIGGGGDGPVKHGHDLLANYMGCASQVFLAFLRENDEETRPKPLQLRIWCSGFTELFPAPSFWESWLYHCILTASDLGHIDVLRFCFSAWGRSTYRDKMPPLFGHLILDAALHSQHVIVELLWNIIARWGATERNNVLGSNREFRDTQPVDPFEVTFYWESDNFLDVLASTDYTPWEIIENTTTTSTRLGPVKLERKHSKESKQARARYPSPED